VAYPLAEMFDDNLDVVESRLNQGEIFIFSGIGTSGLGLSSDTTAIERAVKTKCSLIIKGTGVPGVLADLHDATSIIETITCSTVLEHKDKYGFMDFYAVQKAQEHGIPVRICQCTRGTFSNISMILLQDTSIGTHMKPE
jgi:uridylate kinase